MKKSFLLLISLGALSGCASIAGQFKAAEEPTDGERARIRVISPDAAIAASPGSSCASRALPGAGMVLGRNVTASAYRGRSVGMPPPSSPVKADDTAEMFAAAGKPISFVQEDAFGTYRCTAKPVTFVPEAGKDYEVWYVYDYRRGGCGATVKSLTDGKFLDHINGSYCQ